MNRRAEDAQSSKEEKGRGWWGGQRKVVALRPYEGLPFKIVVLSDSGEGRRDEFE